jgi:predicted membrane GTPase involved in stress response
MRREAMISISRPEVIMMSGVNGEMLEPFEEAHIDTSLILLERLWK